MSSLGSSGRLNFFQTSSLISWLQAGALEAAEGVNAKAPLDCMNCWWRSSMESLPPLNDLRVCSLAAGTMNNANLPSGYLQPALQL